MMRNSYITRDHIGPGTVVPSLVLRPGLVRSPLFKSRWPKNSDVHGSVIVSVDLIAARDASEVCLVRAIGRGTVPTTRASLRCSTRVNEDHGDSIAGALVLDVVDQFAEGPRGNHALEPLTTLEAVTDAIEPFKNDHWIVVLKGNIHDSNTDLVIQVTHPSPFLTATCFHTIKAVVLLVSPSQVCEVLSFMSSFLAIEEGYTVWRGDGCDSHDSQVDAYESRFTGTSGRHRGYANGQHHVPVIATLEQLTVTFRKGKPRLILLRHAQRKPDITPSLSSRNAKDNAVVLDEYAVSVNPKADALRAVNLGKRNALEVPIASCPIVRPGEGNGGVDSHPSIVRGKSELFSSLTVYDLMQLGPACSTVLMRGVKSKLNRLTERMCCIVEPLTLALRRIQHLYHQGFCVVHNRIISRMESDVKSAFLSPLKGEASSGGIL